MKTLIATTIIALASGSASAFDLSSFNDQEFYSGQPDSRLVTNSEGNSSGIYLEGTYANVVDQGQTRNVQGDRIGNAIDQPTLYLEASWPV